MRNSRLGNGRKMKARPRVQKYLLVDYERQDAMGGRKPEYPNGDKKSKSATKTDVDRASELTKLRDLARRPMQKGIVIRGKRGKGG